MRKLRVLFKLIITLISLNAVSAEPNNQELLIGISFSIPPYVIKERNDGLELAILKRCLEANGYKVLTSYLPLARTLLSFHDGSIDGVINVRKGTVEGFYTDAVITFRNYAMSLEKNKFQIKSIKDLNRRSIVAFQKASSFLEPVFGDVVRYNSEYREVADQSLQVKQLFKHRVEVIVMEQKIFKYFRKQLFDRSVKLGKRSILSPNEIRQPIVYHDIFKPSHYRFAFLSERVRDDFNASLREIKRNGEYEKIMKRYDTNLELLTK